MAKILVTMPDDFLHKIDGVASNEQRSRSELIREALRSYIRRNVTFDIKKVNSNAELLDKLLD